MATVLEPEEPVTRVHIEGLAALQIVKHCQESLPNMVTGSLLGLTVGNGVLEITHAFPFPDEKEKGTGVVVADGDAVDAAGSPDEGLPVIDGHEYQLEMMKMLREVNVDNNCVGWYQCMYLGSYSNASLIENQLAYQTDLSSNAVVVLYDPIQTAQGRLVLKCLRLTDEAVEWKKNAVEHGNNVYMDPRRIFQEIPVTYRNPGLVRALLYDMAEVTDCTFDRLDLKVNPYLEKHMEFLCTWVDDLAAEQHKFQYYTRNLARQHKGKNRNHDSSSDARSNEDHWASSDAPRRMESLLISNQIRNYCDQVDKFAGGGFSKLFLTGVLHKQQPQTHKEQDHDKIIE